MAFKQDLTIEQPNESAMKLTLRAVYSQFISENRTILHWEGTCDWSTHSGRTTTTQESGWVIFRPLGRDWPSSSVCVVQSVVQIKPSDTSAPWMEYMHKRSALAKVILPSSVRVMAEQHQCVENSLIDSLAQTSE